MPTNVIGPLALYTFLSSGCTIMEQLAHNSFHKGLQTSEILVEAVLSSCNSLLASPEAENQGVIASLRLMSICMLCVH